MVHDDSTKAAVMAALLEGQSVSSVAREYSVPKGTVSDWKRKAVSVGVGANPTQKGSADFGELLMELLEANIRSLIATARVTANEAWLKKQGAAEIATLFGVKHDKVIRMIEAMNASDGDAS